MNIHFIHNVNLQPSNFNYLFSFLLCIAEEQIKFDRKARYRSLVQRCKIVDLAQAQTKEVSLLRAEVERLRMRTFAALAQVER